MFQENEAQFQAKVTKAIFGAIEELNSSLDPDEQLKPLLTTPLFGDEGTLDSLGLVNLVTLTEEKIEDEFGTMISLADERALSQTDSPFRSVQSLVQYVSLLIHESKNF